MWIYKNVSKMGIGKLFVKQNIRVTNLTQGGLQGMGALADLEKERREGRAPGVVQKPGVASDEMCTFLIMNISSLQLIPVNVIAYRSQYGSVNPAGIVGAGIVATAVSTVVAMVYCKMRQRGGELYCSLLLIYFGKITKKL